MGRLSGYTVMIAVRLKGGLGNQMFQYVAGRLLADRHACRLLLDTAGYRNDDKRDYALGAYGITPAQGLQGWRLRLYRRLGVLRQVQEPGFGYWPGFDELPDNLLIDGYWQSWRYVERAGEAVDHWFLPPHATREVLLTRFPQVMQSTAVAVHVRRGDYVSEPQAAAFHGICPGDYYARALSRLIAAVGVVHLVVFSDDPDEARRLFEGRDATLISNQPGLSDTDELFLMSCCRHHIIANSSFSWWGGWLARARGGQVIAPQPWFRGQTFGEEDLLCPGWQRIRV